MKIHKRSLLLVFSCVALGMFVPVCTDEKIGTIEDVYVSQVAETSAEELYKDFVFNVSKSVGLLVKNSVHILQKLIPVQNESFNTMLGQVYRLSDLIVLLDAFMRDLKHVEPALRRLTTRAKCLRLTREQRQKAYFEGELICKRVGCIDTAACASAYLNDLYTVLKPILRLSFLGVAHRGERIDGILVTALDVAGLPIKDEIKDMTNVARDIVSVLEDLATSLADASTQTSLKDIIERDPSGDLRVRTRSAKRMIAMPELQRKAEEIGNIAWQIRKRIPQAELSDLYRAATHVTQMIINIANLIVYLAKASNGDYTQLKDSIECLKNMGSSPTQRCKDLGCTNKQECVARIVEQTGHFLAPIIQNVLGKATQKNGKPSVSAGLLLNSTLLLELVIERTYIAMKAVLNRRAAPDSTFDNLNKVIETLRSFNKMLIQYTYYLDQAISALPLIATMLHPKLLEHITLSEGGRKVFEQNSAINLVDAVKFTFSDDSLVA